MTCPEVERVIFFGTPEFAVPTLEALDGAGLTPRLIVSQPARPSGRRRRLEEPPVAVWARRHDLELAQPERVASPDLLDLLRRHEPDVFVVVAFGQIFPVELLRVPRLGCVNLHASLLPRHRGAAPIQAAIAAGDGTTGVTTMLIDEGLDTGAVLAVHEVEIGVRETAGELSIRLATIGGNLVVSTLEGLASGAIQPVPQDDRQATYAPRLKRADGRLDWRWPAARLERLIRAYKPWPGTFSRLRDETIKVLEAELAAPLGSRAGGDAGEIGELVDLTDEALIVSCGEADRLALTQVQRAGKRPVSGRQLASGMRLAVGDRFG